MALDTATVLLTRLLSLKEQSQFLLVLDSLLQSSAYLILEFISKCDESHRILHISFESCIRPSKTMQCINAQLKPLDQVILEYSSLALQNTLVVVDSLNYIPNDQITSFLVSLMRPNTTILATYHTHCPLVVSRIPHYPSTVSLLSYIANSIFEVSPLIGEDDNVADRISKLKPCLGFNTPIFKLVLLHRKKSGRGTTYKFKVDSEQHLYSVLKDEPQEPQQDNELVLEGLTTFSLTTNAKQKLAREQVELPFMEAQHKLGSMGGAIVYEYEKDDDYDEEDPYEDPF